jgi:nitroreductase
MTQPWRFKVFLEEKSRQQLAAFLSDVYVKSTPEAAFNTVKFKRMQDRPMQAPVVIAVCMERQKEEKITETDELLAVACAIQNMYLTATAMGLGAFWSTPKAIDTKEMNDFLQLMDKGRCVGLFYMGYPAIEWPKGQRKPIEYLTQWF